MGAFGKSPGRIARVAGAFYLLTIAAGAASIQLGGRAGSMAGLFTGICYLVLTVLFYDLFKPVDAFVSLLAALFRVTGLVFGALSPFGLAPLHMSPLVFFACASVVTGSLILKSAFLPQVLGGLMILAGLGWLSFVLSQWFYRLFPYNVAAGVLGELALAVWLMVKGVDGERWRAQAAEAESWRP